MTFDLALLGSLTGTIESSFALLRKPSGGSTQASLTIFGPEVKPGDKGSAKDWTDVCSTRLNAFSRQTTGVMLYLNNMEPWPAAGTAINTTISSLQAKGDWLRYSALQDHQLESDSRILGAGPGDVEVLVDIHEPGAKGSLRAHVKAKVCPGS